MLMFDIVAKLFAQSTSGQEHQSESIDAQNEDQEALITADRIEKNDAKAVDKVAPRAAPWVTTTGLVIHAFADGISLGASLFFSMSVTQESGKPDSLGILIFVAILLDNTPASIGLGSFLMSYKDISPSLHILAFNLTAPLVNMITFVGLILYEKHNERPDQKSTSLFVGCILLFSAGTFLYVALLQTLPEAFRESEESGCEGEPATCSKTCVTMTDFAVVVGGIITPYFLHQLV